MVAWTLTLPVEAEGIGLTKASTAEMCGSPDPEPVLCGLESDGDWERLGRAWFAGLRLRLPRTGRSEPCARWAFAARSSTATSGGAPPSAWNAASTTSGNAAG